MMKLLAAFFLFLLGAIIEVAAGDTNTNTTATASASASAAAGAGDSELSAKVRAHLSKLTARSDGGPNARVTCTDGIAEAGKKLIVVSELCSCSPSCIRLSLAHLSFSFYHILLCTNNIIHSRLHRWRDGTDWSLATR